MAGTLASMVEVFGFPQSIEGNESALRCGQSLPLFVFAFIIHYYKIIPCDLLLCQFGNFAAGLHQHIHSRFRALWVP